MSDEVNEESDFCANQFGGMPCTPNNKLHPSQKSEEAILKNSFSGLSSKDETRVELKDAHRNWKNQNRPMRSFISRFSKKKNPRRSIRRGFFIL